MKPLVLPAASAGLSLRRALLGPLLSLDSSQESSLAPALESAPESARIDFLEVAPENWIRVGGRYGKGFQACAERFPLGCHGLSLSLGGLAPLNWSLLADIRTFLDQHQVLYYSEHLSAADDSRPLYDLMPMPFCEEAVHHVAQRIRQVQDFLGRQIAVENISYYLSLDNALSEAEFINAVVSEADCLLLLDVNNIYVNSVNHRYDPHQFLDAMPASRVLYYHIAGHDRVADDLCIDTHGATVISPVWQLLAHAYQRFGVKPTLLEREAHLPVLSDLLAEIGMIRHMQSGHALPGAPRGVREGVA